MEPEAPTLNLMVVLEEKLLPQSLGFSWSHPTLNVPNEIISIAGNVLVVL